MVAGRQAVNTELSKRQAKQARFADALDTTPYSHKTGVGQGFLSDRCKALKSNNIWKAYDALHDVSAEIFAKQLKHIVSRRKFGLCICLVDATDEHSIMKHLR